MDTTNATTLIGLFVFIGSGWALACWAITEIAHRIGRPKYNSILHHHPTKRR